MHDLMLAPPARPLSPPGCATRHAKAEGKLGRTFLVGRNGFPPLCEGSSSTSVVEWQKPDPNDIGFRKNRNQFQGGLPPRSRPNWEWKRTADQIATYRPCCPRGQRRARRSFGLPTTPRPNPAPPLSSAPHIPSPWVPGFNHHRHQPAAVRPLIPFSPSAPLPRARDSVTRTQACTRSPPTCACTSCSHHGTRYQQELWNIFTYYNLQVPTASTPLKPCVATTQRFPQPPCGLRCRNANGRLCSRLAARSLA